MVVTNYIAMEDIADNGVTFYDPDTWELIDYVQVPHRPAPTMPT